MKTAVEQGMMKEQVSEGKWYGSVESILNCKLNSELGRGRSRVRGLSLWKFLVVCLLLLCFSFSGKSGSEGEIFGRLKCNSEDLVDSILLLSHHNTKHTLTLCLLL